jgi:F-type H+-transporting ATPase subunit b
MLDLDVKIIVIQLVTFLVGMVLIWKFFVKYFLDIIAKRAADVKSVIEQAENNNREAEKLKAEYMKHIDDIEKQIQQAIKDATKEGIDVKNEIILKARQEAKAILDRTYEKIGLEKEKMLKELKNEVVNMSVNLAEKLIKEKIGGKVDDRLVDEALAEISKGGKA